MPKVYIGKHCCALKVFLRQWYDFFNFQSSIFKRYSAMKLCSNKSAPFYDKALFYPSLSFFSALKLCSNRSAPFQLCKFFKKWQFIYLIFIYNADDKTYNKKFTLSKPPVQCTPFSSPLFVLEISQESTMLEEILN